MSNKKDQNILEGLHLVGLNKNESKVYYYLIKCGQKGTIVKQLTDNLNLKRTTVYSIVKKLERNGFVMELGNSSQSKCATIFAAINPLKFFDKIVSNKKKELELLEELRLMYSDRLENIYNQDVEYSLEDIDENLKLYFVPLMNKGWKLISYIREYKTPLIDHDTYDCKLESPNKTFYPHVGFLLFNFDHNIENDNITQRYFMKMLKKKGKEEILFNTDLEDINLIETKIKFNNISFPGFKFELNVDLVEKSNDFYFLNEIIKKHPRNNITNSLIIGISIVIIISNQMFVLWGENKKILNEIVNLIFKVHNISKS
ncbi:MAG: hypothetical protein JXA99_16975 [Candidatus Lokiarchaeota archaeon]|nr:hypothetical protein [Candidatus Lokiarchaeota archaeon]